MKRVIVVIISSVTLMGCGGARVPANRVDYITSPETQIPPVVKTPVFPGLSRFYAASASVALKGRIYLTHGLNGTCDDFEFVPFSSLLQGIRDLGFEVVSYQQPKANIYTLDGNGMPWRKAFEAYLPKLVQETEAAHGAAPMNIAGGVSFGGLHALMAQEMFPDLFDGFFATLPVTDYTALVEFKSTSSSDFNAFQNPEVLGTKIGFIQYGDSDSRVNWHLTVKLLGAIDAAGPNNVTRLMLTNTDHTSSVSNLDNIVQWLKGI